MSVGLEDSKGEKQINLTQLRRNVHTLVEKKTGRRLGDYDIMPAPDACLSIYGPLSMHKILMLLL